MRTCTNGHWGVSYETSSETRGVKINVYRHREYPAGVTRNGWRFTIQYGQLNGLVVANDVEARDLALTYGYLQTYSRNSCRFVMSRAARRRGFTTDDYRYHHARTYIRNLLARKAAGR